MKNQTAKFPMEDMFRRWEKMAQEREEEEARKKAEWEALPDGEKRRIIALREQERLELEKRQIERERENQITEWQRRGITPRYYDASWENWIAETPEQKEALEKVKQAWEKNLLIVGKNGSGKTHLAMCLAKDGATYCLLPELFRTVRDNMRTEQEVIDRYGSCKLLILDEAGRQKDSSFERNLLFEIIEKRWNYMLPTTIIGNIGQTEFTELYGTAVLDRLRPVVVKFDWGSKRT